MDSNFNSDEFLSTLPTVLTSMNLSTPEFISNEYSSLTLCESDMKDAMNSDEFKNFLEMVHNGKFFKLVISNLIKFRENCCLHRCSLF